MASSVNIKRSLFVTAIVCSVVIGYTLDEVDYEPELGPLGNQPGNSDAGHDKDQGHGEGDKGLDHGHESEGLGSDEDEHGHEGGGLGSDEGEHGHEGGGLGSDEGEHGHEGGGLGSDEGEHGHEGGGLGSDEGEHGHESGGLGSDEGEHGHEGGGLGSDEGEHGHEGGGLGSDEGEHGHEGEDAGPEGHNDPPHIISNALLCLHEKHQIYSNCEESFRLTVSGELHVPHDHVDEFCSGPCFEETNLVLHCIEGIMEHFVFYNRATTEDVRDTVLAGCGHGDHRGDFDVAEHIEADGEGSIGRKSATPVLLGVVITILGQILLLSS